MNTIRILLVILANGLFFGARADLLIKSKQTGTVSGQPSPTLLMTISIKERWRKSETVIEFPGGKASGAFGQMPQDPANLLNLDTGASFTLKSGKWIKEERSAQMEAAMLAQETANREAGMPGNPLAEMEFVNTGKTERIRDFDTEIWESSKNGAVVTAWVAKELVKFKKHIMGAGPAGLPKATHERMTKAWDVLPGLPVKTRIEFDYGKIQLASMPAGAKLPKGMPPMKAITLDEILEIKEVEFTDAEFPLPASAQ